MKIKTSHSPNIFFIDSITRKRTNCSGGTYYTTMITWVVHCVWILKLKLLHTYFSPAKVFRKCEKNAMVELVSL